MTRLLFDENLPAGLVRAIDEDFPGSSDVVTEPGPRSSDESIWAFASERGYVVVTKDEDFQRFSVARGFAPKVVWVRRGNASTDSLVELLRVSADQIAAFVEDLEATFLPLGRR